MLNDCPVPVKWRIALDLGSATAATWHLLVFEALRCIGLFVTCREPMTVRRAWDRLPDADGACPDERRWL